MWRPYDQIAICTKQMDRRIAQIGHDLKWVRDTVTAVNVFLHPKYTSRTPGDTFAVDLAFNYDLVPTRELELIRVVRGSTVQLESHRDGDLSHLGYHIADGDDLLAEILRWMDAGFTCGQVSQTINHTGTPKRYQYAFINTRRSIGTWTKIISRVGPAVTSGSDLAAIIDQYRALIPNGDHQHD